MNEEIQIEILEHHPIVPSDRLLPFVDVTIHRLRQVGEFQVGRPLVFLTELALQGMEIHTQSYTSGELGGLVLGDFCVYGDVPFTWVEVALPAEKAISRPGGLRFTPEAIEEIDKQREARYPHLRPVGWYHSHPGFGVFLSGIDLHTHRTVFTGGPFLAFVLDPIRRTNGAFAWVGNEIVGPLAYWVGEVQDEAERR